MGEVATEARDQLIYRGAAARAQYLEMSWGWILNKNGSWLNHAMVYMKEAATGACDQQKNLRRVVLYPIKKASSISGSVDLFHVAIECLA